MSPPVPDRRVLFVCTHNAGRSIVAAALLNARQPPGVRADSAGTDPADTLNPTVVAALAERGIPWLASARNRSLPSCWQVPTWSSP
jgi:protein-tyrosine-phosphatase